MANIEVLSLICLGIAVGCLCLTVPLGFLALRASPWWRSRAKRGKHSMPPRISGLSTPAKASLDRTRAVKVPEKPSVGGSLNASATPRLGTSVSPSVDLLPSGHRRSEYHRYGATDGDIEFWGLDQPGAPPPDAAGWVVMDMLEEMDADGDGFIDHP